MGDDGLRPHAPAVPPPAIACAPAALRAGTRLDYLRWFHYLFVLSISFEHGVSVAGDVEADPLTKLELSTPGALGVLLRGWEARLLLLLLRYHARLAGLG